VSTTPRTPIHFPRMKIRGHRNKAKAAARYSTRQVLNVTVSGADPVTGAVTFHAMPVGKATHVLAIDGETRDGYGRVVKRKPKPRPKPKPTFSFGMTFKDVDTDALDLLFGRTSPVSTTPDNTVIADLARAFETHDPAPTDLADRMSAVVGDALTPETNR